MPIYARRNLYRGVNAHLHSTLQTPGTPERPSSWRGFHNHYVTQIMEFLNAQLPEGYIAVNEQSLQILGESDGGLPIRRRPVPDVSIYQQSEAGGGEARAAGVAVAPTWEARIEDTLAPDNTVDAVVVYRQREHAIWGDPVARIELLSPSNKPGGANDLAYNTKRSEVVMGGVLLVEIDYLHETPSPILTLPHYPAEAHSHPYYIAVSDPRPTPHDGTVRVYGFAVDAPIPAIRIPLVDERDFTFDFGAPYEYTYRRGPWHVAVDYAVEPPRFATYREADRERIRQRMAALAAAQQQGVDLGQV